MKFKRYSEFSPCCEVIVKLTVKKTAPKTAWKLLIPSYGLLTLKNTTVQIVEASVTVNNVSPIQDQDCFSGSKNSVKCAIARTVLLLRHDAYCTIITISFLSCNAEIKQLIANQFENISVIVMIRIITEQMLISRAWAENL